MTMRVLAVDPGVTTGLAHYDGTEPPRAEQHPALDALIVAALIVRDGVDLVASEAFVISAGTLRKSRDGQTSIEVIGALRWLCHEHGVRFELQPAAEALKLVTNDKLRALGWWCQGDHARDASRHLAYAMARHGAIDRARLLTRNMGTI